MLVAIGGKGLGHLNLQTSKTQGSFVDLEYEPALKDYTLDDTAYLQVSISATNSDGLSALVTTSNSFSYVLDISIKDKKAAFGKIA